MAQPGKLRGLIMKLLLLPYLAVRKLFKLFGISALVEQTEKVYSRLDLWLMGDEKRRKFKRSASATSRGEIVLFERYPLFYPYGDDLKRTVHADKRSPVMPDLLVYLDIDPDSVLQRRKNEDQKLLLNKVKAFRSYRENLQIKDEKLLVLNGKTSIDENVKVILERLNTLLVARSKQPSRYGEWNDN